MKLIPLFGLGAPEIIGIVLIFLLLFGAKQGCKELQGGHEGG